jgi:hypothetical protein
MKDFVRVDSDKYPVHIPLPRRFVIFLTPVVTLLDMGFGLVTGFIKHLWLVITKDYETFTKVHSLHISIRLAHTSRR